MHLGILPGVQLAEEVQPLAEDFLLRESTPVPRQLTTKQEATSGYKPHGLGSRAQDKNKQLERQAPN